MCGVEGKRRLCDLNVPSSRPPLATKHPRKQLGTKRYLLDSDLSGPVVPTSSRHVITHGLTKGNSIGVEIGTV